MNILICGFKGTGKTTLSKKISSELKFRLTSDFEICGGDKLDAEKIVEFVSLNDNFVVDLLCSVSPERCSSLKNSLCIFLGFATADKKTLFQKLVSHGETVTLSQVEEMILESRRFKAECKKFNIPFVDINGDREILLEKTFEEILKKLGKN